MTEETRRGAGEGINAGLIGGVILAAIAMIGAGLMGNSPFAPLNMYASVVLGENALQSTSGATRLAGLITHLVLSGAFGFVYGAVNSRLSTETQTRWSRQVWMGLAFGAVLWLVNIQVIARILYPWFLEGSQMQSLVMHAFFFGLPVSLMYGRAERRVHHIGHTPHVA